MPLFDLSILDVLPKVVADGSEGGVHLYAEVTPESYGSFVVRVFLFTEKKRQKKQQFFFTVFVSHLFKNTLKNDCDRDAYKSI